MDNSELESIAIIGLSGRFPGADNIQQFWQNLVEGQESLTKFTDEEMIKAGVDPALLLDPDYVKSAPIIENAETFDANFFGFSPREAEITDPQHRIFLECAWEALESAGYGQEGGNRNVGLYAGIGFNGYFSFHLAPYFASDSFAQMLQYLVGNDKDYLTTHVSYKLNLRGPSMVVQTACSSSLVAVAQACQSLLNYQCDMALAGGVTVRVPRRRGYLYEEGGVFAKGGHCRAFDVQASGTIYGDGVGILVLKRLDEAISDRDQIYAVIKGFGVNNDGNAKVGYTAPSVEGQATAIMMAQAMANIKPDTVTLIEAHGTGTALGDPIEIAALTQAFSLQTDKKGFCAIGSVKTNVGHLDGAAGVTSLIKTVLALKHKQIPASLNFTQPNPQIDFANSPFYVNTQLKDWTTDGIPRRAGVSSFGFGGTNAHLILEEAPSHQLPLNNQDNTQRILALSAKTPTALQQLVRRYYQFLQENPQVSLADICFTANTGRTHFKYRLAVYGNCIKDIIEKLLLFIKQESVANQVQQSAETNVEAELAMRYMQGEEIDWSAIGNNTPCYRIALPTYPFERERYWIDLLTEKLSLPAVMQSSIQDVIYQTRWIARPLSPSPLKSITTWLIFADNTGIADELQTYLIQQDINYIVIKPDISWRVNSATEWHINPQCKADYFQLKTELEKRSLLRQCSVIYLWALDRVSEPVETTDLLAEQSLLCGSMVNILQAIEKFICKLWLVTAGAVTVADKGRPVAINQVPLLGLSKVISLEYQDIWAGLVDLDTQISNLENVSQLVQEIFSDQQPEYVAYRDQQRFVARLNANPALPSRTNLLFESSATYLITGGLGGLGLKLADWLVKQGVKHVVLMSRQAPSATQQETIQQLQSAGCTVVAMQADVSCRNEVAMVLEKINASLPPLMGIFHLAGILDIATIQQLDWQAASSVLAPKIAGSWNLHSLTRAYPLKYFVMFSSISSVIGALGSASYACANAFLDGLADYRKALELPALSINWNAWAETGMAARLQSGKAQTGEQFGFGILGIEQGLQRLHQLLQAEVQQGAVIAVDWALWAQHLGLSQPFLEDLMPAASRETMPTGELQELFHLPSVQQKDRLLAFIQRLVAKILRIPTTSLPNIQKGFTELGMDSLMAIELKNELQKAIGKKLSATLMFNNPTIAALTEYLLEQVFATATPAILQDGKTMRTVRTESVMMDESAIQHLSEEEILQKIAEEYDEI